MKKVLKLSEYTLRYDKRPVLEGLSFEIYEREVAAICGMAGSAVEFIANALLRVHAYPFRETGDIMLDGITLTKLDNEEMRHVRLLDIGLISLTATDPSSGLLTVRDYILYPYKKHLSKKKRETYVDAMRIMEIMGVKRPEKVFRKKLSSLSPKQLRAVLVAAAFASSPALVVLSAFENAKESDGEFYDLIIKMCKIKDCALLILTSDLSFAMKYGERVAVMERGKIIEAFEMGQSPQSLHAQFLLNPEKEYETKPTISDEVVTEYRGVCISRKGDTLSYDLHRGEILGLFTRSVPMAVNILSGKQKPVQGTITKQGTQLSDINPWSRKIFVLDSALSGMFLPQTKVSGLIERFKRLDKDGERTISVNTALEYMELDAKITSAQIDKLDRFTCARVCLALAALSGADTVIITRLHQFGTLHERYALMPYIKKLCGAGISFILVSDKREMIHEVSDTYIEIG